VSNLVSRDIIVTCVVAIMAECKEFRITCMADRKTNDDEVNSSGSQEEAGATGGTSRAVPEGKVGQGKNKIDLRSIRCLFDHSFLLLCSNIIEKHLLET